MKVAAGKKGRTWGPSSVHQKDKERRRGKNRYRNYSDTSGRASSFPNLGAIDRTLIEGSSSDLCKFILQYSIIIGVAGSVVYLRVVGSFPLDTIWS